MASRDSALMRGQENVSVVTKEGGRRKMWRKTQRKKRKKVPCGGREPSGLVLT